MKAYEAIEILQAIDPNQEVTLNIGVGFKRTKPKDPSPKQEQFINRQWVIGREQWIPRDPNVFPYNTVTCQGNSTVH